MATPDPSQASPPLAAPSSSKLNSNDGTVTSANPAPGHDPDHLYPDDSSRAAGKRLAHRGSRHVVPELPRAQTFSRQQAERRNNLAPVLPTPAERRAVSADRRVHVSPTSSQAPPNIFRCSAPEIAEHQQQQQQPYVEQAAIAAIAMNLPPERAVSPIWAGWRGSRNSSIAGRGDEGHPDGPEGPDIRDPQDHHQDLLPDNGSDTRSLTSSQWDSTITQELEKRWILNLSMHFRDKSKREKFFVTYREHEDTWRRVTVSLDYRDAPENSLEEDLTLTKYQREKSAKIYEAIRDSLPDIQFYDTVTNLKLQTTDGRLHVHVVEDVNEIIKYPPVRQIQHLDCTKVRERDIIFDSHMSGFVYKVRVDDRVLIKKEIPGPDTIDEFLYEVNALCHLEFSRDVISFHGVVVDDEAEYVKGLLISYADRGALVDMIFDHRQERGAHIPWPVRERWASQIIHGLADVHETGYVQGDFTLSNIVIDEHGDAKIIDINRRGCPVGWEPPEATPLTESNQRISMYIGVKSDLYQLGMVLWALAMHEDEPETLRRPLRLPPEADIPLWYRHVVITCLSDDPRRRLHASILAQMVPNAEFEDGNSSSVPPDAQSLSDGGGPGFPAVPRPPGSHLLPAASQTGGPGPTSSNNSSHYYYRQSGSRDTHPAPASYNGSLFTHSRGRSPPSPLRNSSDSCRFSSKPSFSSVSQRWHGNPFSRPLDRGSRERSADSFDKPYDPSVNTTSPVRSVGRGAESSVGSARQGAAGSLAGNDIGIHVLDGDGIESTVSSRSGPSGPSGPSGRWVPHPSHLSNEHQPECWAGGDMTPRIGLGQSWRPSEPGERQNNSIGEDRGSDFEHDTSQFDPNHGGYGIDSSTRPAAGGIISLSELENSGPGENSGSGFGPVHGAFEGAAANMCQRDPPLSDAILPAHQEEEHHDHDHHHQEPAPVPTRESHGQIDVNHTPKIADTLHSLVLSADNPPGPAPDDADKPGRRPESSPSDGEPNYQMWDGAAPSGSRNAAYGVRPVHPGSEGDSMGAMLVGVGALYHPPQHGTDGSACHGEPQAMLDSDLRGIR